MASLTSRRCNAVALTPTPLSSPITINKNIYARTAVQNFFSWKKKKTVDATPEVRTLETFWPAKLWNYRITCTQAKMQTRQKGSTLLFTKAIFALEPLHNPAAGSGTHLGLNSASVQWLNRCGDPVVTVHDCGPEDHGIDYRPRRPHFDVGEMLYSVP